MPCRPPKTDAQPREWYNEFTNWMREHAGTNDELILRLKRNLRVAMEELTPRQQQLLSLSFDQNMRVRDIARELALSPSSVSRTLSRAKLHLYHRLRYTF